MKYTFLNDHLPQKTTGSVIAIGNFDGVHLGHQRIFEQVMQIVQRDKLDPIAMSFYPHPREVLSEMRVALITTVSQRAQKIARLFPKLSYGKIEFDKALSELSAQTFLSQLIDTFSLKHLVIGSTTHIGRNREGTPEVIKELSKEMGFSLTICEPLTKDQRVVSSSLIRNLILKGQVAEVPSVMGEYFATSGEVVHGQNIGHRLGFPTANMTCFASALLPLNGVYAAWVQVGEKRYPGAVNLGYRPTITPDDVERHLEVHIIGQVLDLYGQKVELAWVKRVRDEIKFNTLEELKKQIEIDVTKIQTILDI
ncbi:MAG: riboflavin biosynthesis protein RibF [Bdellovibrionales bacterium]|nr:riboflavin biosynthesis protein RibF [Bdellovibrionales bacterium]